MIRLVFRLALFLWLCSCGGGSVSKAKVMEADKTKITKTEKPKMTKLEKLAADPLIRQAVVLEHIFKNLSGVNEPLIAAATAAARAAKTPHYTAYDLRPYFLRFFKVAEATFKKLQRLRIMLIHICKEVTDKRLLKLCSPRIKNRISRNIEFANQGSLRAYKVLKLLPVSGS